MGKHMPFRKKVRSDEPAAVRQRMKMPFLKRTHAQADASKGLWSFMTWLRKHRVSGRDGSRRNRPALIRHVEKSTFAVFRAHNKTLFAKRRGRSPWRILFPPMLAPCLSPMERPAKHPKPKSNRFKKVKKASPQGLFITTPFECTRAERERYTLALAKTALLRGELKPMPLPPLNSMGLTEALKVNSCLKQNPIRVQS